MNNSNGASASLTRDEFLHNKEMKPLFIGFHKPYLRMLDGNYLATFFLDEIVYWFSPPDSKGGKDSRVGFYRDGYYWLVKSREYWCSKYCTNDRQYNRIINLLKKRGLIVTSLTKRKNKTVSMIRLDWSSFLKQYEDTVKGQNVFPENGLNQPPIQEGQNVSSETVCRTICPVKTTNKGQNVLSLYSILLEEILLVIRDSIKYPNFPFHKYQIKSIGDEIAQVLLSIDSDPKPVLVLNDYDDLWSEYDAWRSKGCLRYYTDDADVNFFLSGFEERPSENSANWAFLLWSKLSFNELLVHGRPVLLLLQFILNKTKGDWLPTRVGKDDRDIVLMALCLYYKAHETEFEWPEEMPIDKPA